MNRFMFFDTIFWDVILGWYHDSLGQKLSKQISYWFQTGFYSQLKIIINFHPKISYQRTWTSLKTLEILGLQLKCNETCSCPLLLYFGTLLWDDITIFWDENLLWFWTEKKENLFWTNMNFVYLTLIPKYRNIIPN